MLRETFGTQEEPHDSSVTNATAFPTAVTIAVTGAVPPDAKRVLRCRDSRDLIFEKFAAFTQKEKTSIVQIKEVPYSDPELVKRPENELNMTGRALVNCVKNKVCSNILYARNMASISIKVG